MLDGFRPIPNKFSDLFKRSTYGAKSHHPFLGFPLLLAMMLFWNLVVEPHRKIRRR